MDKPARRIIAKFGGIRRFAKALGHPYATTVQGWSERELIPAQHHQAILDLARELQIDLSPADFFDDPGASRRPSDAEARQ